VNYGSITTSGNSALGILIPGGGTTAVVNGATIASGGAATVTNSGTIGGTIAAIVQTGVGATTINNNAAGTINGRVLLGAGNDVVNNAGTFNAVGNSTFGAGANVFNNTGTLNVRPGTAVAGTVAFTGLTTFNNTGGLIDLRNGHTGDNLVLPGTYTGTGNARLAIDVNLNTAPTTSDLLTVGGAATGSTAVTINRLGSPAVLSTAAGTTFVDAGAGSTAGAFVIAPASQVDGVIQYGVVYNPLTNDYALVSAPSAAAYRTSLFGEGVRNLWLQSGDAWTAHMRETRDNIAANGPGGAGGRFWFQGYGNWEKRSNGRTVTFNGITSNVDLGYDQDYYGVQMGLDLGTPAGPEGGFNFGITGGYQSSNMSFAGVSDTLRFNSVNGGVYASFNSGIFFVNALGKYDYYWGENRSPAGLYAFDINGGVWGAKAEAGLRFGQDFWVEPAVSVSWTKSDFDNFAIPSGNFAFQDEDGLRGKAGARIGYTTQSGSAKVSIYGGANYVRDFRGRSNVVFTSGGQTAAFSSPENADYVEGTLGVNIGSETGKLSGFFEGRYADGRDYDGYGVRGGVRVRF
jgi:outer membrane autotransporter protein